MSAKAKRHIHKYHKVELNWSKVWACGLPDCNHYMPAHLENLVPGKASVCWSCDEKFILDPSNMVDDKPKCNNCRNGIDPDTIEDLVMGRL